MIKNYLCKLKIKFILFFPITLRNHKLFILRVTSPNNFLGFLQSRVGCFQIIHLEKYVLSTIYLEAVWLFQFKLLYINDIKV